MRSTFDINFYCNPSKASKKTGMAPIYLSIIINGKRELFPLQIKCKPEDFNDYMDSKKSNPIKDYCNTILTKITSLQLEMLRLGKEITPKSLREYLDSGGVGSVYSVDALFTDYLVLLKKRIGVDLTRDVYEKYKRSIALFKEVNNLSGDEPLRSLTRDQALTMQTEIKKRYKPSTGAGYMTKMRTIFKYAFENNKIDTYIFNSIKIKAEYHQEIEYLTQEELDRIRDKKMPNKRVEDIKNVWLFQCYTGLSYADLKLLEPSDYKKADNGMYYICKKRKKTGVEFTAVLLKEATLIALMYNFNLPVKSNQRYNSYLKELADLCNIDKNLHTHVARHTCAMYLLNHRPPIAKETIKKIFGWADDRMLRVYGKTLPSTVIEEISSIETEEDRFGREIASIILED